MAIQKITIEEFLSLAKSHPVLDVRSPGEYLHAHIPGACSLPLFTDEERKVVGTAYKQQSKQTAIKIGLDYFGVKMKKMVEETESIVAGFSLVPLNTNGKTANEKPATTNILVHCWRGGMRSAGVAWLLDLYGFKVFTLVGGYKAYRKWVRDQFEKQHSLSILGGYTGSGKTLVLQELKNNGQSIIDLEGIAHHKGSAFGAFGEKAQPSQEMFENLLAERLAADNWPAEDAALTDNAKRATSNQQPTTSNKKLETRNEKLVWIEDESQRIGQLIIPNSFWFQMRNSPVHFLEIPFEERLDYLTVEYGKFEKEKLVNAIIRIQKRLGGLETKTAINFLLENNHKECFRILLNYYDKQYNKGLAGRQNLKELLNKIPCSKIDVKAIAVILMQKEIVSVN